MVGHPAFPGDFDETLDAAVAGEGAAFTALYEWLAPPVAGFLRARGSHDPDGLTNEVFLRAFRSVHTFRGDATRFRTWVFTITRNALIDERRRRARRVDEVAPDLAGDAAGGDAEADALARLAEERVRGLLERLSPDQREVILLRVVGDLTVDQVAAVVGKGREAVKALQRRGLAALKREIEREGVPR